MKTHIFKLECLTDMHVGNGETNYSIIDNEVQKDTVLTDVPVIHASGVKGSLKNHFEVLWSGSDKNELITRIFGTEDREGSYKFFNAMCIARPLRVSDGDRPYILATSNAILEHLSSFLNGIGRSDISEKISSEFAVSGDIEVEGEKVKIKNCEALEPLIGKEFVVMDKLDDYQLPVRARNKLNDDGQSKNVWHEELVPHKSIFLFAVMTADAELDLEFTDGIPVQFGGNASIGNGYATVTEVFDNEQTKG